MSAKAAIAETLTAEDNQTKDPFAEPLGKQQPLDLKDKYFEEARGSVAIGEYFYEFFKPPYMPFDDQNTAKRKLKEAFTQRELCLLYGYSGCGKTTILTQFAEAYPSFIYLIKDFDVLTPSKMVVEMAECIGLPVQHQLNEVKRLKQQISSMDGIMFLFDEVTAHTKNAFKKIEVLRRIHDETGVPIVLCGTTLLWKSIYAGPLVEFYSSLISRMDEHEMHGMKTENARAYLDFISKMENVSFSGPAKQALIATALNTAIGGINAFTTVLGRCITVARANYYSKPGHEIQDAVVDTGSKVRKTPPRTPEPVFISEFMVSDMQTEYKSHFPKINTKAHTARKAKS